MELPATVAHELHHARRWAGPGYGHTLVKVPISEGLAQWHEHTERGGPPPYAVADVDMPALRAWALPSLGGNAATHVHTPAAAFRAALKP